MRAMRTLVIGGTLFMGRAIVARLVARGHDVSVLHRRDTHDLGPAVRNVRADRRDLSKVRRLVSEGRFDAVFDLAYDWQHGTTADEVEAVADSCGDNLVRYVFMSSMAAYNPGLDKRETDALVADDDPNDYARNKASAERRLMRMHAQKGFPVTTFRPPFVHGPHQPFYREQFFWDRLLAGRPIVLPDDGSSAMPWAFVEDVAESCVRTLDVPEAAGQAFNVGHVEPTTQRSFVELLARAAGVDARLVAVPRARIHAAGGKIIGGNLYFGEYLDLPGFSLIVEKAPRVLGVVPTPIDKAFQRGYEWYRTQPRRPADYSFDDRLLTSAS
jgi:nucleoside-diphosphate-sugar epimerase